MPSSRPSTVDQALAQVARKLTEYDHAEARCGLPPLAEQDLTWRQRADDLTARANALLVDGTNVESVLGLLASGVAYYLALDEMELGRVETGSEAA